MAIVYDTSISAANAAAASTLQTATMTVAAQAALFGFMASGASAPHDPAANGCKWGAAGDPLTKEGSTILFATNIKLSRFSLVPPTVATRLMDGTWAGTDDERAIAGISFTGVDQASPLRASPTPTTGNSAAPSITAVTVAGDEVIACLWVLDSSGGGTTITSAGGQTNRRKHDGGVPFSFESFAVDHKAAVGTSTVLSWTLQRACDWIVMAYVAKPAGAGGAAVLSAATPSGTLGTQTTATIGATTDQNSGTFYAVVDTGSNLSGVTAAEIKAGQRAGGAAALKSGNSAVSTTTPSVGVTGLTAATAYVYAAIQNNGSGDSNIVTGSFTTAAATPQSTPPPSAGTRVATLMLT